MALATIHPGSEQVAALESLAMANGGAAQRAWKHLSMLGLPHRRVEAFKYSDFAATLRAPLTPAPAYAGPMPVADLPGITPDIHLIIANGVVHEIPQARPDTVRIMTDDDAGFGNEVESLPLGLLAAAASEHTITIEVSAGNHVPVIQIDRVQDHEGLAADRVAIILRDGAKLHLVERIAGGFGGLATSLTEIGMQQGAELERQVLQSGSGQGCLAHTTLIHCSGENRVTQTTIAQGDKLARLETHLFHNGPHTEAQMHAAYALDVARHVDITTRVRHEIGDGETLQINKGVVDDTARGVFQGRIEVVRDAQKTDARMRHDALLLSDRAEVNAKPELEIYADDVQCAHGNTVGALDETALFYMRQRGLPEASARALLMRAFLAEALVGLGDDLQGHALQLLLNEDS